MTRVSWGRSVGQALHQTEANNGRLFELQQQLASGKAFEKASQNPEDMGIAQRLRTRIRRDEQLVRNIEINQRRLDEAETFMGSTIEQIRRVRTVAVQAANGVYTTGDLQAMAAEINQQLEGLLRTSNARSAGSALFAGAETVGDPFRATRDNRGRITAVAYAGDDIELEIDAGGNVPVTWPGDRVFAAGSTVRRSTSGAWSGATAAQYAAYQASPVAYTSGVSAAYANRELSASYLPSGGSLEGALELNGVRVDYDLDADPTTGEGDSLLDLAAAINRSNAGVRAEVTGTMRGRETVDGATFGAAAWNTPLAASIGVFQAGTLTVNGTAVSVTADDTIFTLANRITAAGSVSGVGARVVDTTGAVVDGSPQAGSPPYRLEVTGGVELGDDHTGATNVLQFLGVTAWPPLSEERNLVGEVTEPYRLQLTGERPGPFTIRDAAGTLAADLGLSANAGIVESGTLFATLIKMRDALEDGDAGIVRQEVLSELDAAQQSTEVYRTEAGVRTNRLEAQKARAEAVLVQNRETLSETEEVDLAEIISELKAQQNSQQAALKSLSSVLNLSLLNFL